METQHQNDGPDDIDKVDQLGEAEFGEHDEAAQDAEYVEDAREGGE